MKMHYQLTLPLTTRVVDGCSQDVMSRAGECE